MTFLGPQSRQPDLWSMPRYTPRQSCCSLAQSWPCLLHSWLLMIPQALRSMWPLGIFSPKLSWKQRGSLFLYRRSPRYLSQRSRMHSGTFHLCSLLDRRCAENSGELGIIFCDAALDWPFFRELWKLLGRCCCFSSRRHMPQRLWLSLQQSNRAVGSNSKSLRHTSQRCYQGPQDGHEGPSACLGSKQTWELQGPYLDSMTLT